MVRADRRRKVLGQSSEAKMKKFLEVLSHTSSEERMKRSSVYNLLRDPDKGSALPNLFLPLNLQK